MKVNVMLFLIVDKQQIDDATRQHLTHLLGKEVAI